MTLRIQEKIAEETQGLSPEQRLQRQKRVVENGPFAERWKAPVSQSRKSGEIPRPIAREKKRKSFDCVEMKHRIQERLAEETKGMSPEERHSYMRRKSENSPFAEKWKPAGHTESREHGQ